MFQFRKVIQNLEYKGYRQSHGPTIKKFILFLHAWLGCDTTSAIFEKGKTSLLKKLLSSLKLRQLATKISDLECTSDHAIDAGRQIFMIMYGGDWFNGSLTKLR